MRLLRTDRIGQISGSNTQGDAAGHDPQNWPLLNDTTRWEAFGFDEGANTEHNGRLYFFPGDVVRRYPTLDPLNNSHLVAWTEDRAVLRHGGHSALGFRFVLLHEGIEDANNQANWRYCVKCGGLFFDGYPDKSFQNVCPSGGGHAPAGFNFLLPHDHSEETNNQANWRYCVKCGGLFFDGYSDKSFQNVCPTGGSHSPAGFNFVLPHGVSEDANHQGSWRYCIGCGALFWDGSSNLGLCPGAPGGGFHLQAVLGSGSYWPFEAGDPVGVTLSLEPPVSAFSHGGRVYVFAGVGQPHWSGQTRPGDPAYGLYLVSTGQPDQTYPYRTEFLFNPRIGVCPADGGSHAVLGYNFVLPHDISENRQRDFNWFRCRNCASLFHAGPSVIPGLASLANGVCQAGGAHEAQGPAPHTFNFAIAIGDGEDALNQGKWRRCRKCQTMFWSGYSPDMGICPADRLGHEATDGIAFLLSHDPAEDANHVANWQRCKRCAALYWDGLWAKGKCAAGGDHDPIGNQAADPVGALQDEIILTHSIRADSNHRAGWHLCTACLGLFIEGDASYVNLCWNGQPHSRDDSAVPHLAGRIEPPVGYNFVLPHDLTPEDPWHQRFWRRCVKCSLLFSYLYYFDLYFDQWTVLGRAPLAAGDPATMVTPGQEHIFYRGVDGAINHTFWNEGDKNFYSDQWTARTPAPLAAGDPATMLTPGQQHIFYRGADGAINHIFWNAADNNVYFDQWTVRANAPHAAGDPVTMVTSGQQHIFYRGTGGAIQHIFWTAADNSFHSQSWTALSGAPNAAGDPATMLTDRQQHVFYRGTDGAIHHIFWNAADNTFHSQSWTALSAAPPAAGDPATMVTPGQQHVFYRGTDGAIHHIFWNAADNTFHSQSWTALSAAPPAAGDPATMLTDGQQHVFYRGVNGAINHIFWTPGTGSPVFQDWTALARAPLATGDPSTMLFGEQQNVFYRAKDDLGVDSAIHHIYWLPSDRCYGGGRHSPSAEEYIPARRLRQDSQHDRDWRFCAKCFGLVSTKTTAKFWTLDCAVVRNADFPNVFPSHTGEGLVMAGYGWSDFYLAWMPLGISGPRLQDTLYYAPDAARWHPNVDEAAGLLRKGSLSDANRISFAWLEGPRLWILLYGRQDGVFARLSKNLSDWSDEIRIISRDSAETASLYHWVKPDTWPYGPSLLKRYTEWDPAMRRLGIYYLISLSAGYQVHLMHTQLEVI